MRSLDGERGRAGAGGGGVEGGVIGIIDGWFYRKLGATEHLIRRRGGKALV